MTDKNTGIENFKTLAEKYPEALPEGADNLEKIKLGLETTEVQDTENINILKQLAADLEQRDKINSPEA